MKLNFKRLYLSISLMLLGILVFAQVTTSSMRGDVMDESYNGVSSANVTATHVPTGTVYSTTTDENGSFYIGKMRVGGPYTVKVSGGENEIEENEIYLQLGQTYNFSGQMSGTETVELTGVIAEASANGRFSKGRTGAETSLSKEALESLPNATGGIADFVRITPQARVEEDNVINIAGQNNRYNAIYVDGGVDNDVFGLSGSGTDGGQTGGNPFALDELDQITVSVAPYDVRQSGFAGGAINAITRSGTNEFHGSAYWFARNETLAGRTAEYDDNDRESLAQFNADRYGVSLGGPIMKDKLFFFATFEKEELQSPKPFNLSTYLGSSNGTNEINQLYSFLDTQYGFNPGSYGSSVETLNSEKFITRLDWNITDKQSLSFKYKRAEFDQLSPASSGTYNLGFNSYAISFPSKKNSFALDWNAQWTDKLSSKVLATYKTVRDDRDPNADFPTLEIEDGDGTLYIGGETYSTANRLDQDVLSIIGNTEYNLGDHNIIFGAQYDSYDLVNVFIRRNYGYYNWDNDGTMTGLQRLLAGENPDRFRRDFSIIDGDVVGDNNEGAAANFNASQLAFYLQDEWRVNRNLRLTGGVRLDIPSYDKTRENESFNAILSDFENAGYDLEGAKTGQAIKSTIHFSPRVGFNYTPTLFDGLKTQFRGGTGVFTSRIPLVWIGGAYNNTGNTLGAVDDRSGTIALNPDISSNNGLTAGSSTPQVDIFAKDFKLPQRWKTSIGLDQELPHGFNLTLDYQYDEVLNDVQYKNVNITPAGRFTGADDRLHWNRYYQNSVNSQFGEVLLATNTSRGYAHTFTAGIDKTFFRNLFVNVNYTYNDAYSVNNGTSSQNSSQWNTLQTVNGKNQGELGRSDYSMGSRVTALASYTFHWNGTNSENSTARTKIAAFYEGIDGAPYSFVYDDGGNMLNDSSSSRENALFYVPNDISEINLQDGYKGQTTQEQWDALSTFINGDDYLKGRKGKYVERNGSRLPWSNVVDLRILQEFDINVGAKKHTLGFSFDIFNFTNLLNRDWGRRYTNGLFYGYRVVDVLDVADNGDGTFTATYGVDPNSLDRKSLESYDNSGIQSSIWQMQFGVKYTF